MRIADSKCTFKLVHDPEWEILRPTVCGPLC